MSINNKTADPKKIYSILDKPPVLSCGGKLDKDGVDSYWGESLTIQSHEDSANITLIMEKYAKTGVINAPIRQNLSYGDVSQVPEYHTAWNQIARANELFDSLDAKVRSRFHNNPSEMIDFLHDEANLPEAIKLGLVSEKMPDKIESKPIEVPTSPKASSPA